MPEEKEIQTSAGMETATETANRIKSSLASSDVPVGVMEQPTQALQIPQLDVEQFEQQLAPATRAGELALTRQESAAAKEAEKTQTDTIRTLSGILGGRAAEQTALEQQAGLPGAQRGLADLMANIRLQTEQMSQFDDQTFFGEEAMRAEAAGRDITKGTFSAMARERRLQRAMDRTAMAAGLRTRIASAELMQNNITAARNEINAALDTAYAPIEQQFEMEKMFLQRAFNQADAAERREIDARSAFIEKQEADLDMARSLVESAAMAGADPERVSELFTITDPQEQADQARLLISEMASQDRAFELQGRQIERAIAAEQLKKLRQKSEILRPTQVIDQGGRKMLVDTQTGEVVRDFGETDAMATDELALAVDTEKINSIDELKSHPGMRSAVGPTALGRMAVLKGTRLSGSKDDFTASIDQLIDGLTLDKLISAKDQGATFGALSDTELQVLAQSATKIGSFRRKDKKGNTTHYDAAERDFIEEMDKISNFAKLDTYLKGEQSGLWTTTDPATIGIEVQPDGSIWAQNGDGTLTQLRK